MSKARFHLPAAVTARLQPAAWIRLSCWILLLFAAAHFAGWRESLPVLSGTPPPGGDLGPGAWARAVIYVVLYLLTVVLDPVLVLAAVLGLLLRERTLRSPPGGGAPGSASLDS